MKRNDFRKTMEIDGRSYTVYDIQQLEKNGIADIKRLPFSIKILVENLLRKLDDNIVKKDDLIRIATWQKKYDSPTEIPYNPSRVLMQDFTGVPAVVDLAAMRDAVKQLGSEPSTINPLVPVDLIIDHSVQVDYYGCSRALEENAKLEYQRNNERYTLLKWAQKSFDNFRVVPPKSGICHQINLEYLSSVVSLRQENGNMIAFPDTLVGTDSHTTMINGIGVMGWGVGGIEAEAVILGQPYYMSIPEVIGVKLTGELNEGVTATDLVLTLTEFLREYNVVEKFVEYIGPGMKALSLTDRATIANMSPEYGATMGFFPVDEKTIEYLELTGRENQARIVEEYAKALGLFYAGDDSAEYTDILEFDISNVEPSIAGPARPKDRIYLKNIKTVFPSILKGEYERNAENRYISNFFNESGSLSYRAGIFHPTCTLTTDFGIKRQEIKIQDGSIVIAAITSCTNTSNPHVMLGAALLAKNAVQKGIRISSPYIKTSLVPGSKVVLKYLENSGLLPYLEALGFHVAGFGCTTCIGNSGPLNKELEDVINDKNLTVVSVLSGNRNFEARIHQNVKANFLMSPMLVIAFALAGRIDIDFTNEPLGIDPNCNPVYLKDIWPSNEELATLAHEHVHSDFFKKEYDAIFDGDELWQTLATPKGATFQWDDSSTYIRNPPYFENFTLDLEKKQDIQNARTLLILGDAVTTDHISPAGGIPEEYPAGQYLIRNKVTKEEFNSYGSRRGNHEVMIRGTFANIRIKNKLADSKEGSYTQLFPQKTIHYIYDAAQTYKDEGVPLIVFGGKEYGTGSSRDWAAKGTQLLGVKAVIAESFERIHRSNLVGMGVLPLEFQKGNTVTSLGISGSETFSITGIKDISPRKLLTVNATNSDGSQYSFQVTARLDTEIDVHYFENGGILPYVLRKILSN